MFLKNPSHNTMNNSLADEIDAVLSNDLPEESQSNGNDTSVVENIRESSYVPQERESNQSTGVTNKKRVGKYYGVRPGDAIKFARMDATFAVERKIAKWRRSRVQRAAAKIKKREEKFYADCNKIAAMRNASENTEDNE